MKLDLSGYPVTAAGRRRNLFSRIVSIADDYDSLVSGRVYERKQLSPEDALKLMIGGSGTLYDSSLIKAFAGIFR
jgi:HD-GYP domain-containing protein (c-di-GMP phosphodiesterase class II)